ncbi:hypothetical protein JI435_416950 [Parastagonospora nodorum SN15]|uniref:Uncharacterized protein n=1 Tax=Phaeosphaeria nodorum (strain SN15 / ATCC MYA-4574 / FGSC 10173) TaxID=321614 RepID=A0A7U2FEJ1_PHANO|nr:hypothetical protein JI435_416950 [Parastagonospora nodorum SN15]
MSEGEALGKLRRPGEGEVPQESFVKMMHQSSALSRRMRRLEVCRCSVREGGPFRTM